MRIRKIKHRIAITIISVLILALAGGFGLSYINLKSRFLEFSNQALNNALAPLEVAILTSYASHGSLDKIAKQRNWRIATKNILSHRQNSTHGQGQGTQVRRNQQGDTERNHPAAWQQALKRTRVTFAKNLALLDSNKQWLAGSHQPISLLTLQPLVYNEQTIGYLGYIEPGSFTQIGQLIFLRQQSIYFALISAIVAVFSVFLAGIVSRRISMPLAKLTTTAKALSQGDFDARIPDPEDDEVGEICQSFNQMAEKLQQHEIAKRQWLADISHELRTPLAVLQAQIEAFEDGIRPTNPENLAVLSNQVRSVNHLINDLYELSLSDLGALKYQMEMVDLNLLVEEFVDEHQDITADQGLNFTYETPPEEALLVKGDEQRLRQLLSNILQNSRRYTDSPGAIRWSLQLAQSDNQIELHMEDSSPGVTDDQLPMLFKRLYRVDASRNRRSGGAGLGLSICQAISEAHGATLEASQSSLGGVKVILTLPTLAKEEQV